MTESTNYRNGIARRSRPALQGIDAVARISRLGQARASFETIATR
jgi:hypothetical protein